MNIQFKKGVLELCVLSLLEENNRYGYELAHALSSRIQISDGTVYPILRRLKKEGFVNTYLQESTEGPPRKYYRLTDTGRRALSDLRGQWYFFVGSVNDIIEGRISDDQTTISE